MTHCLVSQRLAPKPVAFDYRALDYRIPSLSLFAMLGSMREETEMKASVALIAWTPAGTEWATNPTSGQVKVGPLTRKQSNLASDFACDGGASVTSRRNKSGWEQIALVFMDFHTLVVRDGLSPEVVHRAFLEIDEYAENISPNIDGSREPST